MKTHHFASAASLLVLSLSTYSLATADPPPWVLTADSAGPLKIGMTLSEASQTLGTKLDIDPSDPDAIGCSELDVPHMPGMGMMFENKRLTRIEVFKPSHLRTASGIGIGSTEAEVKAKYTPIDDQPQAYVDLPAKNLTWWAKKDVSGIRFETDLKGHVNAIFAGTNAITYIEGCE